MEGSEGVTSCCPGYGWVVLPGEGGWGDGGGGPGLGALLVQADDGVGAGRHDGDNGRTLCN